MRAVPRKSRLQLELILQPGAAGIRVRPVVPGQNGNWVRTGVSWANLDYYRYGATRTPLAAERLLLVKELLALSRLTHRPNLYSYSDDVVRLETISSRRLWDLLGQASVLGLPLVQPGRKAAPVMLLSAAAEVTVDVIRTESGLRVEPRIGAPDQRVPLERSMLIGSPAHGIAWWDEPTGAASSEKPFGLGLAALATPVDDNLRAFLRTAAVDVPHHDEKRFLQSFVPKLHRKVEVASSDGSVELPEVRPPNPGPHRQRGRRSTTSG